MTKFESSLVSMDTSARMTLLQEALPYTPSEDVRSGSHLSSNDTLFDEILAAASENVPTVSEGELSLGLVIGNGYVLSALPELPVDGLVMADIAPQISAWEKFLGGLILKAETRQEFIEGTGPDSGELCRQLAAEAGQVRYERINQFESEPYTLPYPVPRWFKEEVEILGDYHFLSSEERYQECREASRRTPVVYAQIDMTKPEQVAKVTDGMRSVGGRLTFMNLTNLVEHATHEWPEYRESLESLPLHEDVFIARSSCSKEYEPGKFTHSPHPISSWVRGLAGYISECKRTPHPFFGGKLLEADEREAQARENLRQQGWTDEDLSRWASG